ncbi:SH3 domain-binding protein 2 [Patella vulgata]|uniref:SH3 domain-binding protein 2 n=1 Tax=Patella vulgata TaxID=6465 RepID=UPI00217FE65E|nr:SH3 domain-binding protein 2 [Patella vulgata]
MAENHILTTNRCQRVLHTPQKNIGAQALLNISECSHSGYLAKRGRRERIVERFNLPQKPIFKDIKKWRKRFVIISQGCVYIYDKESSRNPHKAFPLAGYNQLFKMGSDNDELIFRLEGLYPQMKEYQFSCSSEGERKEWMKQLREEMCIANNVEPDQMPSGGSVTDDDVYVYLQKPIKEVENVQDDELYDDAGDDAGGENEEYGSDDDSYDEIPEGLVVPRNRMPLPPTPKDMRKNTMDSKNTSLKPNAALQPPAKNVPVVKTKPPVPMSSTQNVNPPKKKPPLLPPDQNDSPVKKKVLPVPVPQNDSPVKKKVPPVPQNDSPVKKKVPLPPTSDKRQTNPKLPSMAKDTKANGKFSKLPPLSEKDYLFPSSDRQEAAKILKHGPVGTYLVRDSRSDGTKVLAVNTEDDVREYKVFTQGNKVSIDKKTYHNSMRDLLNVYSENNLPRRDITLGKAYSNLDLSAI